jgi:hypothetical protein
MRILGKSDGMVDGLIPSRPRYASDPLEDTDRAMASTAARVKCGGVCHAPGRESTPWLFGSNRTAPPHQPGRSLTMLWTILIILAIIALAIFIVTRVRGRGV